jgi:nucleoside-diphosphate-sugar epimerase
MTRYLVTGGAGFIGSHIVEALVTHGEQVRVLDDFSTGKRENLERATSVTESRGSLDVIEGDVRDLDTVRQATAGVDLVVHLAAIVSVQQSMADPLTTHAVNVTGTLNVLQAGREASVRRVVLASSCAVYGDNDDLPLHHLLPWDRYRAPGIRWQLLRIGLRYLSWIWGAGLARLCAGLTIPAPRCRWIR